ncbi:MAG: hypothetical protein RL514_1524 [Verrucomicrobiota bacterium]|jgi:hypothetical protein
MANQTLQLSSTVSQSPELVSAKVEGETALMSILNGAYYGMDRTGSRIWALIERPRAVSAVVDQLLTEFSVARPTCEQHVLAFIQRLVDANLVQLSDAPAR